MFDDLEFHALIAATHPQKKSDDQELMRLVGSTDFDQDKFVKMLRWHRMIPQAYQSLLPLQDQLPSPLWQRIQKMNMRCRILALKQSAWIARISRRFTEDNISHIVLKGEGLSMRLYGESGYRQSRDIDLMVDRKDIEAASELLAEEGFVRTLPHADASPAQVRLLNCRRKDHEFRHMKDGVMLDLHWQLMPLQHPFSPSLRQLNARSESITVHGVDVSIVSGEMLWLYQCLHGTYSGWYRLRWVCDIALMLCQHQVDWDELLAMAKSHACERSLLEGIGIACRLYDLPVPSAVKEAMEGHQEVLRNMKICLQLLHRMQWPEGSLFIRRAWFWAPAGSLFRNLIMRLLISEGDHQRIRLHDSLIFMHFFIRPFTLGRRILQHAGKAMRHR